MASLITPSLLKTLYAAPNTDAFVDPLNKTCLKFGIDNPVRLAAFLAQVGHESGGLRFMLENLNYSADALRKTFGKYFPTQVLAEQYARKPQAIASKVYANRMGNGDEKSQEGWKYRGKGLIQLTGKQNHERFATTMGMSVEAATDYLLTLEGACMSAGWYWADNKLNRFADKDDFVGLTRAINGGTNGLDDRLVYWNKAKRLLGA